MNKFLPLAMLTILFTACKKDDVETTPSYPASVFTITQQPNQRFTFNFAFSAMRENVIIIQQAGQEIYAKNIDDTDQKPFEIDYNTTGIPITYEITHKFKTQRGNSPWLNGAGRVDTISKEEIAYRFDDRDQFDEDYDDAIVIVKSKFKE